MADQVRETVSDQPLASEDPRGVEAPLSTAQRLELERRLESFDLERANAVDWAKLKAELAARAP